MSSLLGGLAGCIPSAARTNAKVRPGFGGALGGGFSVLAPGRNDRGERTEQLGLPHAEINAQYGWVLSNGNALAVQLKVPALYPWSTLDTFFQFSGERTYLGLGVEAGLLTAGPYGVLTHYLSPNVYVSFTPRLIWQFHASALQINPQVSIGHDARFDFSAFFGVARWFTDDGIEFDVDPLDEKEGGDYRKQSYLIGVMGRS